MLHAETLHVVLEQLTEGIRKHELWHKDVTRTILCRLPYDPRDVADDAHRQCRFGQWYYSDEAQALRPYAAFIAIDAEHVRMHAIAAQLLRSAAGGASTSLNDYDKFLNALDRLSLELYSLKREIEDSVFRRDPLTGAETRTDMLIHLRAMSEMVTRGVQQCSIAVMDLDHFKAINDTYGHLAGDRVLKASVHRVKEHMRPYDKVFRYGGEEFLISMPNTDLHSGQTTIERVREALAETALACEGDTSVFLTASFGIAPLDQEVTVEVSLDRADIAMYTAKSAGRNRVLVWDASLAEHSGLRRPS